MADVICPRCSHCFPVEFSEVLGKEGLALRKEIARLVRAMAGIEDDTERAIALADQRAEAARSKSAADVAASRADMSHFRDRAERLEAALADAERRLAELSGGHNPSDAALIAFLRARIKDLEAKIAYYENANSRGGMPSLRKGQAKRMETERAESCRRNGGTAAPFGASMGHAGVSHHAKPEGTDFYEAPGYCGRCDSAAVRGLRPLNKVYREFTDPDTNVLHTRMLSIGRVWCPRCCHVTIAESPSIEGTWYGAVALSRLVALYLARGVDRETARLLGTLYGFEAGANSLWNARRAVVRRLGPFMALLEELIAASTYCHLDETRYPRADCGGKGHAWAAACRWAAMIIFHRSRSADIFDEALAFLRGAVAVVDGYPLYRAILGEIQRCWRHIVNNLKAAAARATGAEAGTVREQYTRLCSLYERIKDRDTASKAERDSILAQARAIAEALPEDHPSRIEILNAGEALVTFLKYADMPPTNNFDEGIIRRGPVVHRNVRYLLRTEEGARILGTLVSFHVTCRLQGLDMADTLLRILRGEDPRKIFKAVAVAAGASARSQKTMRHAVAQLQLLVVREPEPEPEPEPERLSGPPPQKQPPLPASRNLPVLAQPASRNLPVLAQPASRNLPVLAQPASRNLPVLAQPASRNLPVLAQPASRNLPVLAQPASRNLPVLAQPASRNLPVLAQPASRNLPVLAAQLQAAPNLLPDLRTSLQEPQPPKAPAKLARPATRKAPRRKGSPRPAKAPAGLAPARGKPAAPSPSTRPAARTGRSWPLATARRRPPRPPPRHHAKNRQVPIEPPVPPPYAPGRPTCREGRARSRGRQGINPGTALQNPPPA